MQHYSQFNNITSHTYLITDQYINSILQSITRRSSQISQLSTVSNHTIRRNTTRKLIISLHTRIYLLPINISIQYFNQSQYDRHKSLNSLFVYCIRDNKIRIFYVRCDCRPLLTHCCLLQIQVFWTCRQLSQDLSPMSRCRSHTNDDDSCLLLALRLCWPLPPCRRYRVGGCRVFAIGSVEVTSLLPISSMSPICLMSPELCC